MKFTHEELQTYNAAERGQITTHRFAKEFSNRCQNITSDETQSGGQSGYGNAETQLQHYTPIDKEILRSVIMKSMCA
jgi:hypothetical protein